MLDFLRSGFGAGLFALAHIKETSELLLSLLARFGSDIEETSETLLSLLARFGRVAGLVAGGVFPIGTCRLFRILDRVRGVLSV